jgi:PAS domain S-box-containing protein
MATGLHPAPIAADDARPNVRRRRGSARPTLTLIVSSVVIMLALIAAFGWRLGAHRTAAEAAARAEGANLTISLARAVTQMTARIDLLLMSVREMVQREDATVDALDAKVTAERVRRRVDLIPQLVGVWIADPEGRVRFKVSESAPKSSTLVGQPFFDIHRGFNEAGLFIGELLTLPSGRHALPISRRLDTKDGSLAGVIIALIDPSLIAELFQSLDVGPNGSVAVWRNTGSLLVRAPPAPHMVGQVMAGGAIHSGLMRGVESDVVMVRSRVDAVERMLTYRKIDQLPLVVGVGLASDDYLAAWREDALRDGTALALILAVVLALAVLLYRQLARREATVLALQASEQRFRDFASAASDWFWEQDDQLRFTYISHADSKFSDLSSSPLGKTRRETNPIGVTEVQWVAHDAEVAARRPFRDFRFQRIDQHGQVRHVAINGNPVFDAEGRFIGYRGTGRDVTAEVEATHAFRAVIDAIPAIVTAKGTDGRFVFVNAYMARLFATTPEAVIGKSPADFVEGATSGDIDQIDRQVIATGKPVGFFENRFSGADGPPRDWLTGKVPHFDAQGHLRWVLTVAIDITQRKETERRFHSAQAALIEAKDTAERASRTKSDFLANMSHELRTPLNAIIGFSEVLKGEMFGPLGAPRYVAYAGDIHRSGMHLLDLINDILDVEKIEAGKRELHPEAVDVAQAVLDALRLVEARAATAKVALAHELPTDLPLLWADARSARQILLNLLSNAVKFTPAGGSVTAGAAATPQGGIRLTVTDTGIGIDPQHIAALGTPFFQLDNPLTRSREGTGLGLSLIKSLVELHGGRLSIESAVGRGTTVTVQFPPRAAERPAPRLAVAS